MRTNFRGPTHKFKGNPKGMVLKPTGSGSVRRSRITGAHKCMDRSDRVALCHMLEYEAARK
jgi:hypothetical protein